MKIGSNTCGSQRITKIAILAPIDEEVEKINSSMLSKFDGTEKVYYSSDMVSDIDVDFNYNKSYSTKFLNSIKCSGIPNHKLLYVFRGRGHLMNHMMCLMQSGYKWFKKGAWSCATTQSRSYL